MSTEEGSRTKLENPARNVLARVPKPEFSLTISQLIRATKALQEAPVPQDARILGYSSEVQGPEGD